MRKILIVAQSEFSHAGPQQGVHRRHLLMPVMMGLSLGLRARRGAPRQQGSHLCDRRLHGRVGAPLDRGRQAVRPWQPAGGHRPGGAQASPRFMPIRSTPTDERPTTCASSCPTASASGELFAFVEFPAEHRSIRRPDARIQLLLRPPVLHALPDVAPRRGQRRRHQRAVPAGVRSIARWWRG